MTPARAVRSLFNALKTHYTRFVDSGRATQRQLDIDILWPECKRQHANVELAMAAFVGHTLSDPAWNKLSASEFRSILSKLD